MFFSFDGIDGAGKSTQIESFCAWLEAHGRQVVRCRDPGSTALGEALRAIVLGDQIKPIHRRSEMLLYMAARTQLVEEIIRPALTSGKTVVSDRFLLANVVYQGYAGGLNVKDTWQVGRVAVDGVMPDLTFVLDMPPEESFKRLSRAHDRMERRGLQFFEQVREGFLSEARRDPERIIVIDAAQPIDAVAADVRAAAEKVLQL